MYIMEESYNVSMPEMRFQKILIESNIHAIVFFNLLNQVALNSLQKRDKPRILSLFPNLFNKFNKTWALM